MGDNSQSVEKTIEAQHIISEIRDDDGAIHETIISLVLDGWKVYEWDARGECQYMGTCPFNGSKYFCQFRFDNCGECNGESFTPEQLNEFIDTINILIKGDFFNSNVFKEYLEEHRTFGYSNKKQINITNYAFLGIMFYDMISIGTSEFLDIENDASSDSPKPFSSINCCLDTFRLYLNEVVISNHG